MDEKTVTEKQNWFERNADILVSVALVGLAYNIGYTKGLRVGAGSVSDSLLDIFKLGVK